MDEDDGSVSDALDFTDPDGFDTIVPQVGAAGDNGLGTFDINADGTYTFTLNPDAGDQIGTGTAVETITVGVNDGPDTAVIEVTINGDGCLTEESTSAGETLNFSFTGLTPGLTEGYILITAVGDFDTAVDLNAILNPFDDEFEGFNLEVDGVTAEIGGGGGDFWSEADPLTSSPGDGNYKVSESDLGGGVTELVFFFDLADFPDGGGGSTQDLFTGGADIDGDGEIDIEIDLGNGVDSGAEVQICFFETEAELEAAAGVNLIA
jgi:VCBS repeat-containing protein